MMMMKIKMIISDFPFIKSPMELISVNFFPMRQAELVSVCVLDACMSLFICPCRLCGCKNRPALFPGQMSYKATKPGSVCPLS